MTEIRVFLADVPPTSVVSSDMFADLGATSTEVTVEGGELVLTVSPDLSVANAETARLRLVTRNNAEADAAKDVDAATPLAWSPTATTTAQQIAELRAQVATLTDLFNAVAALVKRA